MYSNGVEIHPALNFLVCHKASQNLRQVTSESGTTASTLLLRLLLIWQAPLCHPLEGTVTVVGIRNFKDKDHGLVKEYLESDQTCLNDYPKFNSATLHILL